MNAEALIGTVLGTCTLQKLVGQGGMGAVFLAQQSRPKRQVAVKVLLPMTPLSPNQLAAFLERFRRETDAAASLEHPNITPVHEYGERDGLAYLVMPYVSGGTLRDEMEREGPLALANVVNYLDQLAAALDFAHDHGVIHRDIKPANILMTQEGRLLLTDFGLVKIIAEGQTPQMRLTGAGAPVGTPDYMAPEQVIGEEIDTRADLYSLGVVLYQMITGATPFQGETPMQIAAQHLQIPPPSPQMLRPDLPVAAEQVVLRALAKRPVDRYMHARDLASAFRMSLMGTGIELNVSFTQSDMLNAMTGPRMAMPVQPTGKGQAVRGAQSRKMGGMGLGQQGAMGNVGQQRAMGNGQQRAMGNGQQGAMGNGQQKGMGNVGQQRAMGNVGQQGGRGDLPTMDGDSDLFGGTGVFPAVGSQLFAPTGAMPVLTDGSLRTSQSGGGLLSRTGKFPQVGTGLLAAAAADGTAATQSTGALPRPSTALTTRTPTGSLFTPGPQGSNTIKLTGPVKVVQVAVPGKPGTFVTGILPMVPQAPAAPADIKKPMSRMKAIILVIVVLLILAGTTGSILFAFSHVGKSATVKTTPAIIMGTPNVQATAMAQANATVQANIILSDTLDHNINNWPVTPAKVYAFKDGAYHITESDGTGRATVLQSSNFAGKLAYSLTMQEIKGDDNDATNTFGMIFRFNQKTVGKKTITTFYSFEVVNTKTGAYRFSRYDDTNGADPKDWHEIWHSDLGPEFHQGQGAKAINTFKVLMDGSNFTFIVNGKKVRTAQDATLTNGTVGMVVNLNGTEVAFKDMLITHN